MATLVMTARANLMVSGLVALSMNMAAAPAGRKVFLPILRNRLRMFMVTSPKSNRDAASRLLFVQKRFHQQRGRQNLVARAVEQIGARHMGGTHRLALAAAQAVFHAVGNGANV